jgi:hypothetical protein
MTVRRGGFFSGGCLAALLITACHAEDGQEQKLSAAVQAERDALTRDGQGTSPQDGTASKAGRESTYLVTVKSASDIETVTRDLTALAFRIRRHAAKVLSVLTKQKAPLLAALTANPRVAFVEESSEQVQEPIVQTDVVPFNYNAILTHNVLALRERYGVSGDGVTVGIWDGGPVLASHDEFEGRVELRDAGVPNDHATHVAGTIGAAGKDDEQRAGGMAPKVHLLSYDMQNDLNEMESAMAGPSPPQITNHSYTSRRGWSPNTEAGIWMWCGAPAVSETEDYLFGKYSTNSAAIDEIAFRNPTTTIFVAAGNERGESLDPNASAGWDGHHWVPRLGVYSDAKRPSNAQHQGYDTLEGYGLAKNVITVGAIKDVLLGVNTVTATAFAPHGLQQLGTGRRWPDQSPIWSRTAPTQFTHGPVDGHGLRQSRIRPYERDVLRLRRRRRGSGALLVETGAQRGAKTVSGPTIESRADTHARLPSAGPTYQIGWGAIDGRGGRAN